MRLKYYTFALRQISFERLFVFFLFIILPIILLMYAFMKNIEPTMSAICESNGKMIALRATNEAVYKYIDGVKYENLITIEKDSNGKIIALIANAMEINKITNKVSLDIQDTLDNTIESSVVIPIGSLLGTEFLGGYGPKVNLKTVPIGEVETKFKSEFVKSGINQTKHSIILQVNVGVQILAPFYTKTMWHTNEILVAETIIVGDTPTAFYEIEGIENLQTKDTLEVIQ